VYPFLLSEFPRYPIRFYQEKLLFSFSGQGDMRVFPNILQFLSQITRGWKSIEETYWKAIEETGNEIECLSLGWIVKFVDSSSNNNYDFRNIKLIFAT